MRYAVLLILGLACITAGSSAAARRHRAAPPPVMYQFRVAVQGRLVLDERTFFQPISQDGRCAPVTGLISRLTFKRPATKGARADLYFVPRMIKGFIPQAHARPGPTTATFSQENTYGTPPPNCTDTAPAPDCATPRPLVGMDTSTNIFKAYRRGYEFSVGVGPGARTRPPFKSCLFDSASVFGGGQGTRPPHFLAELENPHLVHFTLSGSTPVTGGEYGTGPGSFSWKVTLTRIRHCGFRATILQRACLRGLR